MQVAFAGSFPKIPDDPDSNEDVFVIGESRVVLCDGASESFDSQTWARALAHHFADDPGITHAWVEQAVKDYQSAWDVNTLSWSKQAAFERGSFSTLLGIEIDQLLGMVNVLAVGDSLALLVDDCAIIASWPYTTSEQFSERPVLLSTISTFNGFVAEPDFYSNRRISWSLAGRTAPLLLCMTDALGQWVLRMVQEQDRTWEKLLTIQSADELGTLVLSERAARRMRVDDSTLIVLRFDTMGGHP